MIKLIVKAAVRGSQGVELFHTGHGYAVRYGLRSNAHQALAKAIDEFSCCVMDSLSDAGFGHNEHRANAVPFPLGNGADPTTTEGDQP